MSDLPYRQQPRRASPDLKDLTLIVRPPGQPTLIQVFAEEQRVEAEQYAARFGAVVEDLPLPYADNWLGPLAHEVAEIGVAPERS